MACSSTGQGTRRIFAGLIALCCLAGIAQAGEDAATLEQEINAFMQSADHMFAPETAARAQAYLGAAMLPDIQQDTEEVQARLSAARATLKEARRLAEDFRSKHADLIRAREQAGKAMADISNPAMIGAEKEFATGIRHMEAGKLNQSIQHLEKAHEAYKRIVASRGVQVGSSELDYAKLLEETHRKVSRASAAGAKSYAPQTYLAAKEAMQRLRAYVDGLTTKKPAHPERALKLAEKAREITLKVKMWRKKTSSHERLLMQARAERLRLARALGLPVDADDLLSDVSTDALEKEVNRQKAALTLEQKMHVKEITRLKREQAEGLAKQKTQLESELALQRQQLIENQGKLVSGLKESFRVKLERETFEKKRQQRVRKLFGKDEVEILANLDGSLLIRLRGLKFAPGSRIIANKYFDLLSRLKMAFDIYADRKISIEGHTDDRGDLQKNQLLSLRRAEAVRDFLTAAGMDSARMKAVGHGEVRPIASNEFDKGRAMNRRIDIIIAAPNG